MQALGRVAESAGRVAASGELRLLHPPAPTAIGGGAASGRGDLATDGSDEDGVVVSLAAVRARRAGHPAGSNLR